MRDEQSETAGPASGAADEQHNRTVVERVASALGDAAGHAADYVETAAGAVGSVVGATARRFDERPGARVRRVRRMAGRPLPYLYEVHPDARSRTPRQLGLETIDVDTIAGTAVGPPRQRGGDFLPLKPFRSLNWAGRWQRINHAAKTLAVLPPIDVLRYGGESWVVDGHNRVAQALYGGQAAIDADVTELVDPSGRSTAPPESFASLVEDSRELRSVVSRSAPPPQPAASPSSAPPSETPGADE